MKNKLIADVCILSLSIIIFSAANIKAEMLPLTNNALAEISAKGLDIKILIHNTVKIGLLQGGNFSGEIGGIPIRISTGDMDSVNNIVPAQTTFQNTSTIRLSGYAQQNLSAFNNFNAVNSAVNVGINLVVIVNSTISKLSPIQTNWGVNFANSQMLFHQ